MVTDFWHQVEPMRYFRLVICSVEPMRHFRLLICSVEPMGHFRLLICSAGQHVLPYDDAPNRLRTMHSNFEREFGRKRSAAPNRLHNAVILSNGKSYSSEVRLNHKSVQNGSSFNLIGDTGCAYH